MTEMSNSIDNESESSILSIDQNLENTNILNEQFEKLFDKPNQPDNTQSPANQPGNTQSPKESEAIINSSYKSVKDTHIIDQKTTKNMGFGVVILGSTIAILMGISS